MTAETAVVLPLFIGFLMVLLFYFRIMQVQIGMEQAMAYTARSAAASLRESDVQVNGAGIRLLLLKRMEEEGLSFEYIDKGKRGISLRYSEFENKEITLHTSYEMTVPVGFFGKLTYPVEQEVSARKWSGWQEETGGEGGEDYVYVTKNGKVYHKSRECAYLELSIRSVSVKAVEHLRNQSGEKYRECGQCRQKKSERGICYITDYGNCYHSEIGCSSLKRCVYLIPLKEAETRRGCSKCSGE